MTSASGVWLKKIKVALRRLHTLIVQNISYFVPWPLRPFLQRARGVKTGKNVFIGSLVVFDEAYPEYIYIEDNVQISAGARIVTHDSSFRNALMSKVPLRIHPVTIKRNAYVGCGAIILPGVTVGESAIVGAGSVVASDIPPRAIVVGAPAKVIGTVDEKIEKFLSSGGLFLSKYYEEPRQLTEEEIREIKNKL